MDIDFVNQNIVGNQMHPNCHYLAAFYYNNQLVCHSYTLVLSAKLQCNTLEHFLHLQCSGHSMFTFHFIFLVLTLGVSILGFN